MITGQARLPAESAGRRCSCDKEPGHHEPEQYDQTNAVALRSVRPDLAQRCRAVTESRRFALTVFAVILLNAVLLGVETYSGLVERWQFRLRLGAHADRPRDFLKDPWNLFDLAVVLCAFLPVVRENATVLRLLRLARVLRTARFLPPLRIVLVAVARSLPGTLSFLLVGALLPYVYARVGWVFFGRHDPGTTAPSAAPSSPSSSC